MTEMISKHDRPFYRGGNVCYVRPVPAAIFAAWLKQKFRGSGFEIDGDGPVQNILVLADEVPYNVQMLAHNCWEELRYQGGVELTAALVHEVFQRTVNGLDPMFAHTWSLLSPVQQRTMHTFRRCASRLNATEMARSAGLSDSSFKSALRWLHEHDILRDHFADGKFTTRFADPFFAQWIRTNAK